MNYSTPYACWPEKKHLISALKELGVRTFPCLETNNAELILELSLCPIVWIPAWVIKESVNVLLIVQMNHMRVKTAWVMVKTLTLCVWWQQQQWETMGPKHTLPCVRLLMDNGNWKSKANSFSPTPLPFSLEWTRGKNEVKQDSMLSVQGQPTHQQVNGKMSTSGRVTKPGR